MSRVKCGVSFLFAFFLTIAFTNAQTITESVPAKVDRSRKYLIYLHGGIVQDLGAEAVSEDFGKYEYTEILQTFKDNGFNVISAVRPKGTEITSYSEVIVEQVNLLRNRGVRDRDIVVVGASLGAYMTIEAAYKLKLSKISYVLVGLCSGYAIDRYTKYKGKLRGNFLSIYEESDQKGSCQRIFEPLNRQAQFKEISLDTGKGHGFLFKPNKEWVTPIVELMGLRKK